MKRALITGITGQDGSYLAEFLLERGYEVWGLVRRVERESAENIRGIRSRLKFVFGDLGDRASLESAVQTVRPDELYNLASQSFVPDSWANPDLAAQNNAVAVCWMLETIRRHSPATRFYQASSSEMFGHAPSSPQNENTPFRPFSPHGISKLHAHWMTVCYRKNHGIYAVSGISYNHESSRRRPEFVTRKVTLGVADIKLGRAKDLRMGDLTACRDWGYAGDYVKAMWKMLQRDVPEDFVIATGRSRSIRDLLDTSFAHAGLRWEDWVRSDDACRRPADSPELVGDITKARTMLGWQPETSFEEMIGQMVDEDLNRLDQ